MLPDFVLSTLSLGDKFNFPLNNNKDIPAFEFIKELETKIYGLNENGKNEIRSGVLNEIYNITKRKSHVTFLDKLLLYNFHETKKFFTKYKMM